MIRTVPPAKSGARKATIVVFEYSGVEANERTGRPAARYDEAVAANWRHRI